MTSPPSKKELRAIKCVRREFWRRCRILWKANESVGMVCYVREAGATIRILINEQRSARSQPILRASIQLEQGGSVVFVNENSALGNDSTHRAIEGAVTILRQRMILDDLAGV